ncbi:MAG: hypothetical protein K2G42_03990, partial [Clostridia bacterium]|nr:hypothetical protein [Clostridia bacterium]
IRIRFFDFAYAPLRMTMHGLRPLDYARGDIIFFKMTKHYVSYFFPIHYYLKNSLLSPIEKGAA